MKTRIIANPFYCYIISFGLALFVYSWGWSEIYPTLTMDVVLFLGCTFGIAYYLGKKIEGKIYYKDICPNSLNSNYIVIILIGYGLEFLYNKGIPIISVLRGVDISYMDFGIPTFHVALQTFTGYYTIYLFHQYLSNRSKFLLLKIFIILIPNVLIINRGALVMTLTACVIVYLFSIRRVVLKNIFLLVIGASTLFYGFGYLGNERSFNGDASAFLRLTKATSNFTEGMVPNEYYWLYIYASSPFANFQNATLTSIKHRYDFVSFISWELLPDFISKRIIPMEFDIDGRDRLDYSINPILTVGSLYFEPYIRLGWLGPIIVFLFYALLSYFYVLLFRYTSHYFVSGIAVLCVVSFFNVFENMINFSGLSLQLVYPVIFSVFEKSQIRFVGSSFKKSKHIHEKN